MAMDFYLHWQFMQIWLPPAARICENDGADKEYNDTCGVSSSVEANSLSLKLAMEARVYVLNAGSEDRYKMFRWKDSEFTFTVDDSQTDSSKDHHNLSEG